MPSTLPSFDNINDELAYYKDHAETIEQELAETKFALEEFQLSSKELEEELEKEIDSTERRYNEIKIRNEAMRQEVEDWKEKYHQALKDSNTNINQLTRQLEDLRQQTENFIKKERELEQDNDDLERTGRAAQWSLQELERKYNVALERQAILESEVAAKAALAEEVQRLKDELRDTNVELAVMKSNQATPSPAASVSSVSGSSSSLTGAGTARKSPPPATGSHEAMPSIRARLAKSAASQQRAGVSLVSSFLSITNSETHQKQTHFQRSMAYVDSLDDTADADPVYQSFRHAPDARPVKIPTARHPATGEYYVIWSDITDCFPGVVRVQHGEYFVPLLRNQDLYRIKPHGIRCHPGIVLDIIYSSPFQQRQHLKHPSTRTRIHGRNALSSRGEGNHRRAALQPISDMSDSDDHGDRRPSSFGSFTLPSSRLRTDSSLKNAQEDSETLDYAEDQEQEEEEEEEEEEGEEEWHSDEPALPVQMTEKVRRALHVDDSEVGDSQEQEHASDSQQEEQGQEGEEEDAHEESQVGDVSDDGTAIVANGQDEMQKRGKRLDQNGSDSCVLDHTSEDTSKAISPANQALLTAKASDFAHRRIEDVLRKRYRWVESLCPKLFIILPNKDVVHPTATEHADLDDNLTLADFRVYFCCDYGGLDCDMRYGQQGYPIRAEKERDFIQYYGTYVMGVLETLKYGVIFNDVSAPPDQDPMMQIRLSMAMKFLQSQNVFTSEELVMCGDWLESSRKRISPLSKQQLSDFMKLLVVEHGGEPHGDMNPCPTPNRDVQWLCQAHWIAMSGPEELNAVQEFIKDAVGSVACEFQASRAARVVIKSPEKARDFYRMADKLKTVCAFRLVLDWDFTPADEEELCEALSRFQAPVVKIVVRPSVTQKVCVQGLAHGYSAVITQALKNERIEAFMMGLAKEDRRGPAGHDERRDLEKGFPMLRQDLVRFKRNTNTGKVNISIAVINFDMAMITVRMAVEGLHNLSKFNMLVAEIKDSICIKFIKPGQPGSEIEDTGYRTDNPTGFFKKRRGQDSITYTCLRAASTLLHSTALVEVRISFVYARDRNTVREILRHNKRLERLELFNATDDDPSQIYETFKALMVNHPRLESLEITQRQGRPLSSSFKWEHVSDPAKMTVSMNFCETDKVVSMFQRYATSLSRIQILGISAHDAAVLEKALRPKKGPFKLEHFMITGAVELEAAALEDLKKIILRVDIPEVCITCSVDQDIAKGRDRQSGSIIGSSGFNGSKTTVNGVTIATFNLGGGISGSAGNMVHNSSGNSNSNSGNISKTQARATTDAVVRLVDFLVAIRFKITQLNFWGIYTRQILQELEFGWERSAYMPNLTDISVMDGQEGSFLGGWTRNLLYYKSSIGRSAYLKLNPTAKVEPLRSLELHEANMTTEDWEVFLKMVDFGEIHTFVVSQTTPMAKSTLVKLAEAVPKGSKLVSFLVDAPGPTWQEMTWLRHEVEKKAKGLWS
ncbi:NADH:ubiquinone oxidoreductase [Mortierella alpina]|nr:NADH:ubiquinone oxidoreductase [Mortierella alpina]